MAQCPSDPAFNVAETAALWAQTAGVLAGFAFSALAFLSRPRDDERRVGGLALTMIAAFVSLVISSLMWSVLAGETAARGRAAAEELANGLPFTMAIIMIFHGVSLMLGASHVVDTTALRVSQMLAAIVIPTISMFYFVVGASDIESARIAAARLQNPDFCGSLEPVDTLGLVLVVALAVVLAVAWILRPRHRLRRKARDLRNAAPLSAIITSVLSAFVSGLASMQRPEYVPPLWAVIAFLVVGWLLLVVVGCLIIWGTFTNRSVHVGAEGIAEPGPEPVADRL
jgi:hypothetical protein